MIKKYKIKYMKKKNEKTYKRKRRKHTRRDDKKKRKARKQTKHKNKIVKTAKMKNNIFDDEIKILREVGIEPTTNYCYLLRSKNPEMFRLLERKRMTRELDMNYDNIPEEIIESEQSLEPEPEQSLEPEPEQSLEPEPEIITPLISIPISNFSNILKSMEGKIIAVVVGIDHSHMDDSSFKTVPSNCKILFIQPPYCNTSFRHHSGMSETVLFKKKDTEYLKLLDKYKYCDLNNVDSDCKKEFMSEIGKMKFGYYFDIKGKKQKKFYIDKKNDPFYYITNEEYSELSFTNINRERLKLLLMINGVLVEINIIDLFRVTGTELIHDSKFGLSDIIDRLFIYLDSEFNFRKNGNEIIISSITCKGT